MPQMKPMMWTLMLMLTSLILMITSTITHFSYSDKLPHMDPKPYPPTNKLMKMKTNDK